MRGAGRALSVEAPPPGAMGTGGQGISACTSHGRASGTRRTARELWLPRPRGASRGRAAAEGWLMMRGAGRALSVLVDKSAVIEMPGVEVLLASHASVVLSDPMPLLAALSAELLSCLRRATQQRSGVIGCNKGIWAGGTGQGGRRGVSTREKHEGTRRGGLTSQQEREEGRGGQGQVHRWSPP